MLPFLCGRDRKRIQSRGGRNGKGLSDHPAAGRNGLDRVGADQGRRGAGRVQRHALCRAPASRAAHAEHRASGEPRIFAGCQSLPGRGRAFPHRALLSLWRAAARRRRPAPATVPERHGGQRLGALYALHLEARRLDARYHFLPLRRLSAGAAVELSGLHRVGARSRSQRPLLLHRLARHGQRRSLPAAPRGLGGAQWRQRKLRPRRHASRPAVADDPHTARRHRGLHRAACAACGGLTA